MLHIGHLHTSGAASIPDLNFEIENQIAEGDTVAAVVTMTGTHNSDFMGVPATGRRVSVAVMDTGRVREGRFTDHWGLVDGPELMTQLGVAPPVR
jgi:predicted ester cyclase